MFSPFEPERMDSPAPALPADPGAHAGAQSDHAAGAVRGPDRASGLPFEGKLELALAAIVFAAALDGIDGRVARMIKGQSQFGAELDSLADFVNFGCAPGLILYLWGLHELGNVGWIAAMVFAICAGAAARALQRDDRRSEPAGLGRRISSPACRRRRARSSCCCRSTSTSSACPKAALDADVALYARDRLPDGVAAAGVLRQDAGKRVPPEMVLPVFVLVVLFFALLITYPWEVLTIGTLAYLACLPFGWLSYREYERKDAEVAAAQAAAAPAQASDAPPPPNPDEHGDRPARLN